MSDLPYFLLFAAVAVPSLALGLMTVLQPKAVEGLRELAGLPYIGALAGLVELRQDLVSCCSTWLYIQY